MIGEEFILVYVCSNKQDYLNAIQNKYLRLIGGQSHLQCREHRCTLVLSHEKKLPCEGDKKSTYTCSDDDCNDIICSNCFKEFYQNTITFINPSSVTNNIEAECGSYSSENEEKNISQDRLNEKLNDDHPEINLDDFSITSQYNYVTFNALYFLSRDNDDTQEFVIPNDFTPTTNTGDIAVEL